jgi:hypothetical protein
MGALHMVSQDLIFLTQDKHFKLENLAFLKSFIRAFSGATGRSALKNVEFAKAQKRAITVSIIKLSTIIALPLTLLVALVLI